ncbi:hypothetical protein GWC95_12130 [Sediminibacterium roseum]|uniref:DUF3858 domain-containing protein n=1 Tax=Sediminibacterium roseum TaxID=1978412 RepID=A0ABX0A0I6_9BACT|nr:hypothetical protein [Sediminibacterium roseum]NCI50676.1 hypothetical protein [Sediminibacterium roseum]
MNKTYGDRGSYRMREKMAKSTKEEVLKTIAAALPGEVKASSLVIDSLRSYDEPFSLSYDLKFDFTEDVVYFNPLLGEAMKKNPFSSARRLYPVEMPSKMNEVYILNMEIPKGYAVDEMPKSVRFKLNDTDGMFEYLVSKSAERLQMRCRIALNKANFANEDYESLREFFSFVIQKQGEQIVFKKIKS